jgi:pectinesterase
VAADDDLGHAAKGTVQTYLGRPWKPFSRVVFMQNTISDVVDPKGWVPWERELPRTRSSTASTETRALVPRWVAG